MKTTVANKTTKTGITAYAGSIDLAGAERTVARFEKLMEAEPNLGKWVKLKNTRDEYAGYVKQLTK